MLLSCFGKGCVDGGDTDKNCVWLLVLYLREKVIFICSMQTNVFPKNSQASYGNYISGSTFQ